MKKTIGIVLCFLLSFTMLSIGFAEGDILFQNVPWLSGAVENLHQLSNDGILTKGIAITPGSFSALHETFVSFDNDLNSYMVSNNPKYDDVYYGISYKGTIRKKIAGYAMKNLQMMYANDGEGMKLITVSIDFFQPNYQDLQYKLQSLYGEGEYLQTEEGIWIAVWQGNNNSCVMLWSEDEGNTADLIYGRTDAEQILNECLQKIHVDADPDDTVGL